MNDFLEWCRLNDSKLNPHLAVRYVGDEVGFGMIANENISQDCLLFKIPLKMMITCETQDKLLKQLINEDELLSKMPNLALTFQVMNEYCKKDSFWRPYLRILPTSYSTVVYFELEEMFSLEASPSLLDAVKFCINAYRQYAYFWLKLNIKSKNIWSSLPFYKHFTFQLYRWALSTVMTRQNQIPSDSKSASVNLALIPLWDMCNHQDGKFSTDFEFESKSAICYAMQNFTKGKEVTIYYGNRPNCTFFIHNGFVYSSNANDYLKIRLGMSKSDPLLSQKAQLCFKLLINTSGWFNLYPKDYPIDGHLLAFLRIFNMSINDLDIWLNEDAKQEDILNRSCPYFNSIDLKVNQFLTVRAKLLLNNYLNKRWSIKSTKLTLNQKLINQLIESEKTILKSYLS